jgi:hypothetical protein
VLQAGRSQVRNPMTVNCMLPNPSRRTRPWTLLSRLTEMSTRNGSKNVSREELGRCARQTISPPFVSLLSKQCGILNISQFYRPPYPITGLAPLFMYMMFVPNRKHIYELPRPVTGSFPFLYRCICR